MSGYRWERTGASIREGNRALSPAARRSQGLDLSHRCIYCGNYCVGFDTLKAERGWWICWLTQRTQASPTAMVFFGSTSLAMIPSKVPQLCLPVACCLMSVDTQCSLRRTRNMYLADLIFPRVPFKYIFPLSSTRWVTSRSSAKMPCGLDVSFAQSALLARHLPQQYVNHFCRSRHWRKEGLALVVYLGPLYGLGASLLFAPSIHFTSDWFVKRKSLAYGMM